MKFGRLSGNEKDSIRDKIEHSTLDQDDVLKEASRLISQLSKQLGVIITPQIDEGIFQRMELVSLTSDRLLVIITIQTGMLKTITMDYRLPLSPWMFVDATAAIGMAQRLGLGKFRHLENQSLWLQESIQDKGIELSKVYGPAIRQI